MKELITYKNITKFIFLSIITLSIWGSIGSKYISFQDVNNINIKFLINYTRFYLPLFLVIFLFFYKKNYEKSFYLKSIIFFIFFSFLIGNFNLYQSNNILIEIFNNDKILIQKGYVPNIIRDIMMSVYFICTYFIFSRLDQNETEILLKINYIFLLLISLITLYHSYIEYFYSNKDYLYFTQFLITGELFGVPTIRSLGLSRNMFVIFIPLAIFFIFSKEKKFQFFIKIILIFLCLNIFQLQSRSTIYSFYIFNLIIFFILFYKKNFKKIISLVIIFLLIPQFLNFSIPNIKKFYKFLSEENKTSKVEITEFKKKEFNINSLLENIIIPKSRILTTAPNNPEFKKKFKDDQYVLISEYSSGRIELWRQTLNLFNNKSDLNNSYLGFGPSADRFFLKESVSNAILYSLISGGYVGVFFIILFYLYILKVVYHYYENKEKYSNYLLIYSLITIILFLMLRSLVESSFLVFGSDNIILFMCLFYLNSKRLA